jgi:lipopolysaccharide export system permease protein
LNLLDRHILKSVLGACLGAISLFAFLLILVNSLRDLLAPLLSGQLGYGIAAQLLLIMPLTVAQFALPMGILTGVLLTLGRLSADSEIVAMRAAGISLLRIARPIFLLGAIGGLLCLGTNFYAFPKAKVKYERDLTAALRRNPLSFIVPKTFIRDFKGCVIYVGSMDGTVLHDVWFWKLDDQQRMIDLIRAASGRIDFDEKTNELVAVLTPAQVTTPMTANREDNSEAPLVNLFGEYPARLPLDRYFHHQAGKIKPEWLTYEQLYAERDRLAALPPEPGQTKEAAVARMKLELVIQDKYNLAIAAFAFAFVAVPLGIRVSRRETSANLGVALALVIGYYLLVVAVKLLDRHPEYRPDLLLWLPNVIFFALGLWLFRRIEK